MSKVILQKKNQKKTKDCVDIKLLNFCLNFSYLIIKILNVILNHIASIDQEEPSLHKTLVKATSAGLNF